MASKACDPTIPTTGFPVVIHRQKFGMPVLSGTIAWVSEDEFKLNIDRPLQFQERLLVAIHSGTEHEIKVSASVDNLKQQANDLWLVHGSFDEKLNDQLLDLLDGEGQLDRRREIRRNCELSISMKSTRGSDTCEVSISNISSIGCCFHSVKEVELNERVELFFEKNKQQVLCVPAIVCRAERREGFFVIGCSFMTSLELLASESARRSNVDWQQEVFKLLEDLPSI